MPASKKKDIDRGYPVCPHCTSNLDVVRMGHRTTKRGILQRYRCNVCKKSFTDTPLKYAQYPPKIIFSAISTYNMGYTKQQVMKILSRKFDVNVPIPTIHSWLKRYQDICTITRLRKRFQLNPKTVIRSKKLHHVQVYTFRYHDLKLNLAAKRFPMLRTYLRDVFENCPDTLFSAEGPRCSSLRAEIKPRNVLKFNNAPKLAGYAQTLSHSNRDRHEKVEDFMLVNDSATVAAEIPVFMHPDELPQTQKKVFSLDSAEPLTGHIDILQVRYNQIHVLDYKPHAKRDDRRAAEQVFSYALALSNRTFIPLENFTCAYFDDRNYFQFRPQFT